MNELKKSDSFIKLHLKQSLIEVSIQVKAIISVEENGTDGTIVSAQNGQCFLVEETPKTIFGLMDEIAHKACSIRANAIANLIDLLGLGKKPDDPRQARKVVD